MRDEYTAHVICMNCGQVNSIRGIKSGRKVVTHIKSNKIKCCECDLILNDISIRFNSRNGNHTNFF